MLLQPLRKSGARSRGHGRSSPLWTCRRLVAIALHPASLIAHRSTWSTSTATLACMEYCRKLAAHQPSVPRSLLMQHMGQLRGSGGSEITPGFRIWKWSHPEKPQDALNIFSDCTSHAWALSLYTFFSFWSPSMPSSCPVWPLRKSKADFSHAAYWLPPHSDHPCRRQAWQCWGSPSPPGERTPLPIIKQMLYVNALGIP